MSNSPETLALSALRLRVVRAIGAVFIAIGLLAVFIDLGVVSEHKNEFMFFGFGWVIATLILDPKQGAK
ncbi:hypothetical protein [Ponticaulis sp.]|uniref:hypothetical protein n=1 Tax=Ponticaulis sp. TaxID=2020902 RepID=UPI000B6BEF3A|nr:hypothetical protein [Ponticaulis sp.]MAI90934.1 hypothetical protein [Ponticaulis sp.]OUX98277.1 MAG: hypothetical protein CBB65_10855 [Hyphomonadaceae bacterium TMED5]|tara:strand:- start:37615 stop:37821 length:207 start_codon:yes stop_codon:yes gene_type:complete